MAAREIRSARHAEAVCPSFPQASPSIPERLTALSGRPSLPCVWASEGRGPGRAQAGIIHERCAPVNDAPAALATRMVALAGSRGGPDNITVWLVNISPPGDPGTDTVRKTRSMRASA